jgi:hypothetical protein
MRLAPGAPASDYTSYVLPLPCGMRVSYTPASTVYPALSSQGIDVCSPGGGMCAPICDYPMESQ